ncbi:MAG: MarR family transcriptional regulator [Deltaproteobacteria bacterium]|nr:MarR family transcriptional regulator [Deltaproteobacteria bacterium]
MTAPTPPPDPTAPDPRAAEAAPPHELMQFVESFSMLLEFQGMQRMAGRVFAYLLICDPPAQSSAQLAAVLHASRGAVSGAVNLLLQTGLAQRVRRRGDRNLYVEVPPGALARALEASVRYLSVSREQMEHGLRLLADAPPARRARLEEGREIYAFFEREYPRLLLQFAAQSRRGSPPTPPEESP